jgi:hypothetical protein
MATTTTFEAIIRLGDSKLRKENITHLVVIVLACVDELQFKVLRLFLKCADDGRNLHKVWTGASHKIEKFFMQHRGVLIALCSSEV